jgi:hypothetical protein
MPRCSLLPLPRRAAAAVALGTLCALPAAHALTLHGVDIPPQVEVGGKTLTLNGAGTRYVFLFKVYTAALYLPQKSAQPQTIYAMPGPKELKLTMLRDVSGKELADKLNEGIKNNLSPEEFQAFIPSLAQLGGLFAQKNQIKTGETVTITELPGGKGSTIAIDGVASGGTFTEPQFFNSMLKIWLGKEPAEQRLKRALLGNPADSN